VYTFKGSRWSSHSLLLKALPDQGAGRRVLDVGCGPGYLGSILAERGYRVTGVEQPGPYTASFPSSVELVEADLEQGLPPLTEQFDFVLCADILEHLRRPEVILTSLRSVLAPGGVLIASLPNSGNVWFRLNILLGRFPQDDKGLFDRTHLRFYMWKGWVELFRSAGFEIESVQPTAIPVSLVVPEGLSGSPLVQAGESVFYGMARMRKQLFGYQFVVRARPRS
jgi:SAM-dependent methyltransferase